MAFYIPASQRRRRLYLVGVGAAVVGVVVGILFGRLSAPTVSDRIHSVRNEARVTSAGLRVIALHDTAVAVGSAGDANGGTALVLQRTRQELLSEFTKAPWLNDDAKAALLSQLTALDAISDKTGKAFGDAAGALADAIDKTFGD